EDLRKEFDAAYFKEVAQARAELREQATQRERALGRKLTKQEKKQFILSAKAKGLLRQKSRYDVASNAVAQVSSRLDLSLSLNPPNFKNHYQTRLALPYPLVSNLNATQIARFEEQSTRSLGVDLEVQSTRVYPYQTNAAHILGCLQKDDRSVE